MCQKEDHLLSATLDHGALTMLMVGCQQQTMSMIGGSLIDGSVFDYQVGSIYSVNTADEEMTHVQGGTEQDGVRTMCTLWWL